MQNYFPQLFQNIPQQPQVQSEIKWVQGESGAKSYLVAPNQTVVLFDSESNVIYLKSADQTGMPNVKVLDYTIRDSGSEAKLNAENVFATKDDMENLQKEIDALKSKMSVKKGDK